MVSVIMPAYNAEKTILQSVESVFEQSYTEWELIIVDDCSTDRTVEIIEAFLEKRLTKDIKDYDRDKHKNNEDPEDGGYPQIRILKNSENRGVAYSRNKGVDLAEGEWIAFLDSDDLWTPEKLEKQVKYVIDHDMKEGLIFTGSTFMTEKGAPLDYILRVPEKIDRRELQKQNVISCSSALVSRDLILKYRFPESIKTIHEDFAVWLGILDSIKYAYGIDEPLLNYRISEASKSGKKTKAALMNWNTYRYVGLGFVQCLYYMIHYAFRGALKWARIRK